MGEGSLAQRLAALLDEFAATDVTALPDPVVCSEVAALLTAAHRLDAVLAARLVTFDQRGLAEADGFRTARAWLRGRGRLSGPAAAGLVRRGRVAATLPAVSAAATAGHLTAEHLTPIARLTDRVGPAVTARFDTLLAEAGTVLDPAGLAQVCDRIRAHADPDGPPPDPTLDHDRRHLTCSRLDGMLILRGQLDPEGAAAVLTALDALMPPPTPHDPRTTGQRRADALVDLARGALSTQTLPTTGGQRPQIGILITPTTLTSSDSSPNSDSGPGGDPGGGPAGGDDPGGGGPGGDPGGGSAYLDWIGAIPPDLARRIACDADTHPIVVHPTTGLPLYLGRTRRLVPTPLRRALHARDRGCRWPGCHTPSTWTDAHHIHPWYHGGPTDITNLVLLCRYHHHLLHEGHWKLHLNPTTGHIHITRPDGRPYDIPPSTPWTTPTTRGHPTAA